LFCNFKSEDKFIYKYKNYNDLLYQQKANWMADLIFFNTFIIKEAFYMIQSLVSIGDKPFKAREVNV